VLEGIILGIPISNQAVLAAGHPADPQNLRWKKWAQLHLEDLGDKDSIPWNRLLRWLKHGCKFYRKMIIKFGVTLFLV
jgi:hypothetical protein